MDKLTFISKMVESMAWPMVVGFSVYFLRDSIAQLLKPLYKIKYGELEMEFTKGVKDVAEKVEVGFPLSGTKGEHDQVKDRILQLIPISPKAAIIEAWRHLEAVAIDAAQESCIELTDAALRKPIYIGEALQRNGFINEETLQTFKKLRELRNEAAHYEKMEVLPKDALSYLNSVIRLSSAIRESINRDKSTHNQEDAPDPKAVR